ncbi:ACP phosphodiesterase [Rheinheimera baltica]|uniref:ACP phosphodiesterase n=1 Tax=Rheinheimera baltica TaxID=67576 RepID=A0ABT9HTB0_9GAMM|nr:ACP phosphodiesterase [Rheinheimera baltica]MDP5134375.1 ACP phosphodiesterase [Rheinheimera baltica]
MNYLAHTALAQPNHFSLVGNLLGDFCKGTALTTLPPPILAGLKNHRAVDVFTDSHPSVRDAKKVFSPSRRRFAGIALDVLFDHFLICHWTRFYDQPFSEYKQQLYTNLAAAEHLMPASMALTMRSVRQHDWFLSYQQLTGLGHALDRIASRIRFNNQFAGIIEEIKPNYALLEQVFLQFYPQLQQHVVVMALE